jgi:hypothetical protein
MLDFIFNILRNKFGVDRSIIWGVINKAFGLVKGPVSIYFLITYLSPQEQGLWYTFGSLSALTIFAELGFTSIITQFVSHEYARLDDKSAISDSKSTEIDRLMGLIRFSVRVYLFIIPTAILILLIVGYFYFKTESLAIYAAWFIFSIVGGIYLFLGLLQSIYQGLDKVKDIQINIFISSSIMTVLNWTMLMMHFKIWALVIGNLLGLLISSYLLFRTAPKFWKIVLHYKITNTYHFFKETMPLQMRYAITWASSYFIMYLYVPATYKLVGQVQAGQLGMTIVILTAINGIANNWIFTKVPKFNMLVSLKDYLGLNSLFKRAAFQGLFVQLLFSVLFIFGLYFLHSVLPSVSNRFLSVDLTFLLLLPQIAQYIVGALAVYLRAHKEEPFMWLSVTNAALMICAVFGVLSHNLGLKVLFYCLNLIYWVVIIPLAFRIFSLKKKVYLSKYY